MHESDSARLDDRTTDRKAPFVTNQPVRGSRRSSRYSSASPVMSNENEDTVSESCVLLSDDADNFAQSSDSDDSSSVSEESIHVKRKDDTGNDGNTESKKKQKPEGKKVRRENAWYNRGSNGSAQRMAMASTKGSTSTPSAPIPNSSIRGGYSGRGMSGRGRGGAGRGASTPMSMPSTPPVSSAKERRTPVADHYNQQIHPSRCYDRPLLGDIMSDSCDKAKAFNAIRLMVELQKFGTDVINNRIDDDVLNKLDITQQVPDAVNRIPLPVSFEISHYLDLLESRCNFTYEYLHDLQKIQERVKSGNIRVLGPNGKDTRNQLYEKMSLSYVESIAQNSNVPKSFPVALINLVAKQNKLRHEDSHRHEFIVPQISEIISKSPLYRFPSDTPEFKTVKENMKIQREIMMNEIRRRKLLRRRAWDVLGDRYLDAMNKWETYVNDLEASRSKVKTTRNRSSFIGLDNPSYMSSESNERPTSDVVRSEYEQLLIFQQLDQVEAMNRRIAKGIVAPVDMTSPWVGPDYSKAPRAPEWPSHICKFEENASEQISKEIDVFPLSQNPDFVVVDASSRRLTTDGGRQICSAYPLREPCPQGCNCARQLDVSERHERMWSDIEKCIFVDKFMQYPKNFAKIASFLKSRSTQDCIKFYYDSKPNIPYKALLKEADNRRRRLKSKWVFTTISAHSVGGIVYPPLNEREQESIFELPFDDNTFTSYSSHPSYNAEAFRLAKELKPPIHPYSEIPIRERTFQEAERRNMISKHKREKRKRDRKEKKEREEAASVLMRQPAGSGDGVSSEDEEEIECEGSLFTLMVNGEIISKDIVEHSDYLLKSAMERYGKGNGKNQTQKKSTGIYAMVSPFEVLFPSSSSGGRGTGRSSSRGGAAGGRKARGGRMSSEDKVSRQQSSLTDSRGEGSARNSSAAMTAPAKRGRGGRGGGRGERGGRSGRGLTAKLQAAIATNDIEQMTQQLMKMQKTEKQKKIVERLLNELKGKDNSSESESDSDDSDSSVMERAEDRVLSSDSESDSDDDNVDEGENLDGSDDNIVDCQQIAESKTDETGAFDDRTTPTNIDGDCDAITSEEHSGSSPVSKKRPVAENDSGLMGRSPGEEASSSDDSREMKRSRMQEQEQGEEQVQGEEQ